MSFSDYTSQAVLNSLFGKTSNFGALASRPTMYVGVSSTTPTEAGGNVTEPSGGAYARITTSATDWGSATLANPASLKNAVQMSFPTATADWVAGADLTYVVIYDAASGGNYIASGAISAPQRPILTGDTFVAEIGELEVTLT